MSGPRSIWGVVKAFDGQAPGPSSDITYTIRWNDPCGGVLEKEGQIPQGWRWPDDIDIDPRIIKGKYVHGLITPENEVLWDFVEPPAYGCDTPALEGPVMLDGVVVVPEAGRNQFGPESNSTNAGGGS